MSGERHRPGGDTPGLSHQRAEELISDQLDGPLDAASQRALSAHLEGCPSCSHFAAQMGVMGEGLRELPRLPASPTVARQVRERIAQPATLWDRLGQLFSGQLGLAPVAATAALLVAVVTGALALDRDGDEAANNPTVAASTQISIDRTLTSTRATGEPTATRVPGVVLPTDTPERTPLPNIRFEATTTPTETAVPPATETPVPPATETTVPTPVPTETPLPTPTESPAPREVSTATGTPVPPTATATEVPATATPTEISATATPTAMPATETPTEVPATATAVPATSTPTDVPATATPTEVPTELPTATEVPPTATATEVPATATPTDVPDTETPTRVHTRVPTDTPEPTNTVRPTDVPTRTPTRTPTEVPTEEPAERGAPTIAPLDDDTSDGGPNDGERIDGTDETPVEQPTEEPVDVPTETPVDDEADGDDELPIDPIGGTSEAPVQTPEGGTGGPIEETATEVVTGDETPIDPVETTEGETPDVGGSDAILDDTSRISTLPQGTGAPIGQLAFSPDGTLMVVSDASGIFLRVVDRESGGELQQLGAGAYPIWSPGSGALLFQDIGGDYGTVALYWTPDNSIFSISDPSEGAVADVPAGWVGATAYYLRTYDSGRIELRGWDAGTGASLGEVWSLDDAGLVGVRPLQTNAGFLIPTADGWLLVTPDGGEQNLGGTPSGFVGDGLLSPDGSRLAIVIGGGLAIVDAGSPGNRIAEIPYAETVGAGFSWSPDGALLAVSDGASITVYAADGSPVGAATSEAGVTIAGPQLQEDGVYFVQTSGEPSLRRFDLNRLLP